MAAKLAPSKGTSKYRTVREWEIELPERGSAEWVELVATLFDRQDIADDFWPTEMVVSALVSEAELNSGLEFPGYKYLDEHGVVRRKVLATVHQVRATKETVYDPAHWEWSLEPTERELENNVELSAAQALERVAAMDDPDDRARALRHVIGILSDHVADRY